MTDKLFPNAPAYAPINNVYNRAPCAKQALDANQQYYYNMPINNNYNQLEAFNMLSPQNCHKNQNVCMYPDLPWDNRACEDALKIPDKIEMIEITSKDLSPASYCSNLDLLMPDFYKTMGKDLNYFNKFEGQYNNFNTNQKIDYPSCAQSSQNTQIDKTVKYCSIQSMQKTQDFDYGGAVYGEQNYPCKYLAPSQDFYCYDSNKLLEPLQSQYFDLPADSFQPIDQQTEGSNDESDIIVEESDDEIADCVDYDNKKIPSESNKCIICNISYTPLGTQFYFLTLKSPLTMSSQKPVFTKIVSIVGKITNEINYLCSECLGLINTIDHLQFKLNNFNSELLTKFRKTCHDNNVSFNKNWRKKKFREKHDKKVRCKLCKKVLSLRQICKGHLKRHKMRGFLCELCGTISPNKLKFRLHYQKHKTKPPKIKAFVCTNCPKSFRTKSNLVEHENYCLGLLPYCCKFCDKKFASTTKLKNHVKLKHDKKFVAICSICNIGFVKLSDYKSHKISHSTDKKFACTKCDKSYKTLSNLNFHMKVHSNKLPFICSICNKGFMRKEYLEAHVNNHNGIKNFSCNICDKKFVSQKNLDSHLKYHDGSAKTNTCNICGKVMTTGFEEHLRIHNNLREFECDQCDSRFNTKGTLAKHKKRKHVE